jgi:hypothetical protein
MDMADTENEIAKQGSREDFLKRVKGMMLPEGVPAEDEWSPMSAAEATRAALEQEIEGLQGLLLSPEALYTNQPTQTLGYGTMLRTQQDREQEFQKAGGGQFFQSKPSTPSAGPAPLPPQGGQGGEAMGGGAPQGQPAAQGQQAPDSSKADFRARMESMMQPDFGYSGAFGKTGGA